MIVKKVYLFMVAILFAYTATAQWTLDSGHSKFAFIASHHGISEVDGYFKEFTATITSEKEDLSDAVFEASIESASIFTDLEMRDNHLKSPDMFDIENHPKITFKSSSFKQLEGTSYQMKGDLTMKGITKPVTLDVTMIGPVVNPGERSDALQIGIKALTIVNRSDFGIGESLQNALVSDEIELRFTGEFNKGE